MIFCDLTVLYYHRGRVTGISRVVQRYADYLLRKAEARFIYLDRWTGDFREMPRAEAETLIAAEERTGPTASVRRSSKARRWLRKLGGGSVPTPPNTERLSFKPVPGVPLLVFFVFSQEHRRVIGELAGRGMRVHAFVYDLIPIRVPQFCDREVANQFPSSIGFLLDTAECLFCISAACAEDLAAYAKDQGKRLPRTEVVYLGDNVLDQRDGAVEFQDVVDGAFLCVATIEPRKNQEMLVNLWDRFAVEERADIPPLILAGQKGWLVDDFFTKFQNNPRLAGRVHMRNGVSDKELAALYDRCRMTLFPSFYETWSLPIRESLAAGKFVLASDSAGLCEAGEGLTEHIDPLDFMKWRERVIHYANDDDDVAEKEAAIRARFVPRSWYSSAERAVSLMECA